MLLELMVTIVAPSGILMMLSGEERLGPALALIVALAFPLGWGVVDLVRKQRVSAIAVLALVSIGLTGGVGLFELAPEWIAVKEALMPTVIGVATITSAFTRYAVLPTVLDVVLDPAKVSAHTQAAGQGLAWQHTLRQGTIRVGGLFLLSAVGNFALARFLVVSPAGTPAFNEELGRLTAASFPVIMLPMMLGMAWILRGVLDRLEHLAGVEVESLLRNED